MPRREVTILATAAFVGLKVSSATRDFELRSMWATAEALLAGSSSPDDHFVTPVVHVRATTVSPANPVTTRPDPVWWRRARAGRSLYAQAEYRNTPTDPWRPLDDGVLFVINHAPEANAGPDQLVELDVNGATSDQVRLDATGSSDPDATAPTRPWGGALRYAWHDVSRPTSASGTGVLAAAIATLPKVAAPTVLPAGTTVPAADRGVYVLRVDVEDDERATVGNRAGWVGRGSADVRLIVGGPAGTGISLLSPTQAEPLHGNFEEGVDVAIYFRVPSTLVADPAYADGWLVRCTVRVSRESQVIPSSSVGTVVFRREVAARADAPEVIRWDGRETQQLPGWPAVGAFRVELEVVKADGTSTTVPGRRVIEDHAIVLDFVRWLHPFGRSIQQTTLSGTFGESGHAGSPNMGGMHAGVDLAGGTPPIYAARSGTYARSGTHRMEIAHARPDKTVYLHAQRDPAHATGDLVLQGDRLGTVSNVGTVANHLHFEHLVEDPSAPAGHRSHNPLAILPVREDVRPTIEAVFIRGAPASGGPPHLDDATVSPREGISGLADLVPRIRDNAHPHYASPIRLMPYRVWVEEALGVGAWSDLELDVIPKAAVAAAPGTPGVRSTSTLADVYAVHAVHNAPPHWPLNRDNHYLPYLRWNASAYGKRHSPVELRVRTGDRSGATASWTLSIGPVARLTAGPTWVSSARRFDASLAVENHTRDLHLRRQNTAPVVGPARAADEWATVEDFFLELHGAPPGWTVTPGRTGPIQNGATAARPGGSLTPPASTVAIAIVPPPGAPPGIHTFELAVCSSILRDVGMRIPVTCEVV